MSVAPDELRTDHLSPYARAQHRNLLIAGTLGFLFVVLAPDRLPILGVSINSSDRSWLLTILLASVGYFEFAFFAASRADYHVWRRRLSNQKGHLADLLDERSYDRDHARLDENLTAGEKPAEIERRREALEMSRQSQRSTREHLVPVVRSFEVRGWVDFWLAPVYGVATACLLTYQLVCQLT